MCFPGRWRREVRIRKGSHRWQGETWYYGPCGKRMKQFPEVIKVITVLMIFLGTWAHWQEVDLVCSGACSVSAGSGQSPGRAMSSLMPLYLFLLVPEPQRGTQCPP